MTLNALLDALDVTWSERDGMLDNSYAAARLQQTPITFS
jgi:hypothetical protein